MRQPFLLSGEASAGVPAAQLAHSSSFARWQRALIVFWLLGGLAFVAFKLQSGKAKSADTPTPATHHSPTAISTEDLMRHMRDASTKLDLATQKIRRSQEQIARVLPSVERSYMLVEKGHLEAATAIAEAARHDLEESRQQFELIMNSIKKEQELE